MVVFHGQGGVVNLTESSLAQLSTSVPLVEFRALCHLVVVCDTIMKLWGAQCFPQHFFFNQPSEGVTRISKSIDSLPNRSYAAEVAGLVPVADPFIIMSALSSPKCSPWFASFLRLWQVPWSETPGFEPR